MSPGRQLSTKNYGRQRLKDILNRIHHVTNHTIKFKIFRQHCSILNAKLQFSLEKTSYFLLKNSAGTNQVCFRFSTLQLHNSISEQLQESCPNSYFANIQSKVVIHIYGLDMKSCGSCHINGHLLTPACPKCVAVLPLEAFRDTQECASHVKTRYA